MVPEFENAAFSLSPNETSDLVKTQVRLPRHPVTARRAWSDARLRPDARSHQQDAAWASARAHTLLEEQMQGISEALRRQVDRRRGQGARFTVDRSAPLARGVDTPPPTQLRPGGARLRAQARRGGAGAVPAADGLRVHLRAETCRPLVPPSFKEVQDRVQGGRCARRRPSRPPARRQPTSKRAPPALLWRRRRRACRLVRKETPSASSRRGQPMGDLGTERRPRRGRVRPAGRRRPLRSHPRARRLGRPPRHREEGLRSPRPSTTDKACAHRFACARSCEELFRSFMQEARKRVTVQPERRRAYAPRR